MLIFRAWPELDRKEILSPAESSNSVAWLLLLLSLRGLKTIEKGGLAAGLRNAGRCETGGRLSAPFELAFTLISLEQIPAECRLNTTQTREPHSSHILKKSNSIDDCWQLL